MFCFFFPVSVFVFFISSLHIETTQSWRGNSDGQETGQIDSETRRKRERERERERERDRQTDRQRQRQRQRDRERDRDREREREREDKDKNIEENEGGYNGWCFFSLFYFTFITHRIWLIVDTDDNIFHKVTHETRLSIRAIHIFVFYAVHIITYSNIN